MNFKFTIFNFQNNLIQSFAYLFIGIFVYLYIATPAGAACTPIYGGGPTCSDTSLTIKKEVLNPSTNKFVHNLGMSDPKYQANELVTFRITLTNNGNKPIEKIIVKDTFPSNLIFTDGPGRFDKSKNILIFQVDNLASHHSQLFTVNARVVSQNKFPQQNSLCQNNNVSALPSSGPIIEDSSQFCLEKLKSTPATGAEMWSILSLFPTALAGFSLKKLARN